jgi:DNA-binding MarR family transcriptional regulator
MLSMLMVSMLMVFTERRRPRMADRSQLAQRRLQTQIVLDLQRVRNATERRIAELLHRHELDPITPAQANALMALVNAREPLTGADLARELGLSEVTVGRFVKALLDGEWVAREKDPADGRRLLLMPTAKTREALPRFVAVSNTVLDEAFVGWGSGEVEELGAKLAQLRDRLEDGG